MDCFGGKTVSFRIAFESDVLVAREPVPGCDPQPADMVHQHRAEHIVSDSRGGLMTKDGKPEFIETCEPVARSKPEIAIGRLSN
jgi:hypothetical protein